MIDIARYIQTELDNPLAAKKLIEKIMDAIDGLSEFPFAYPVYPSTRKLKNEYRKRTVDNYIVFYYIDKDKMTVKISRVIYAKRDITKLL
ncbi:MAG: type II toxin-antitoxin system RelE/ParE family toxin [Clostridia bacterium]|nr:type II toxin-antitoxin system RelE/ParE family toxin [Clostridia bacterium]